MWLPKMAQRAVRHKKEEADFASSINLSVQICTLAEIKVLVICEIWKEDFTEDLLLDCSKTYFIYGNPLIWRYPELF